jgi:hypothetical protein
MIRGGGGKKGRKECERSKEDRKPKTYKQLIQFRTSLNGL